MISHIEIKDFAIIKDLSLDLFPGLNVITGETGSGKSVVIEAVSMALGARADTDYIRSGAQKAYITMVIDTDDDQYVIKREISNGKSLCRVNGEIVSLSELAQICSCLVDIHGQYEQQSLLNPDNHINILDLYGGEELRQCKENVSLCYKQYAESSTKLMNLRKSLSDAAKQKDFLSFEINEIESAKPLPGEDEALAAQINLMKNSEKIYDSFMNAYDLLYSENGAAGLLSQAADRLDGIAEYSEEYKELASAISDAYYEIDDANSKLRKLRDGISFSEDDLDSAIERQNVLNMLKKKYGSSIEDVLAYCEDAKEKLKLINSSDDEISSLERQIALDKKAYDHFAEELTLIRKRTADELSSNINRELLQLSFSDAVFKAAFSSVTPKENGVDTVEFLISANRGEEPKALAKIASGGELSRIMLAMKRIIADIDGIPTLIFDEIDSGISGAAAGTVGEKMKDISQNHQLICITHLPQIACKADHHFKIEKFSDEISTQTGVTPLDFDQRVEEIARLLSGTSISDAARAAAKELLQ